jgi:hypothetical protein
VSNIHLTSDPYGPYAVRDGKTAQEVLALETDTRLPEIQVYIDQLGPVAASGIPVFIGGDFNAPSRLDWTEAMVGKRAALRYALDWPVSKALADAGFRDSYREIHPDPVVNPGITWSSGYPVPHLLPDEAVDRTTRSTSAIPRPRGPDLGQSGGAISTSPSIPPSDHHGDLELHGRAGAAPAMVSSRGAVSRRATSRACASMPRPTTAASRTARRYRRQRRHGGASASMAITAPTGPTSPISARWFWRPAAMMQC